MNKKAMEADLHEHIHLENNILFPKSVKMEEGMNEAESREPATRKDTRLPARAQPHAEAEEAPPEPFSPVCYLKEFENE